MGQKMKLNFMILDRTIENKFIKFLNKKGFNNYVLFYGKGSASSAILEYLGIGESEKEVILIPSNEEVSATLFEMIKNSEFIKHVIAFKTAINGISSKKSLDYFLKEVISNE